MKDTTSKEKPPRKGLLEGGRRNGGTTPSIPRAKPGIIPRELIKNPLTKFWGNRQEDWKLDLGRSTSV